MKENHLEDLIFQAKARNSKKNYFILFNDHLDFIDCVWIIHLSFVKKEKE
jgi:hypothetical protein